MALFDLAVLIIDGLARLFRSRAADSPADAAGGEGDATPREPALHNRFGGRAWRYDASGVHADGRLWRTPGAPTTCRAILALYGDVIFEMSKKHGVDPALIVMTIATETGALRASRFTGPKSFRWEAHVANRDMLPMFKGSYSAGPMQILATTARDLIARHGEAYALAYKPLATAPAYAQRPMKAPVEHPLYDARTNIELGTAVIRRQMALTGDDPILVAAAYNSGGLYESRANAWRLRSHGDHLDRAARWYGDACAVLREAGLR